MTRSARCVAVIAEAPDLAEKRHARLALICARAKGWPARDADRLAREAPALWDLCRRAEDFYLFSTRRPANARSMYVSRRAASLFVRPARIRFEIIVGRRTARAFGRGDADMLSWESLQTAERRIARAFLPDFRAPAWRDAAFWRPSGLRFLEELAERVRRGRLY